MEEQAKHQHFFTRKRVIWISLLFVVVIAIIALTIVFVILPGLDFGALAKSFKTAFEKDIELSIILLLLLLGYIFIKTISNVYPFILRMRQAKIKIKMSDYILFGFLYSFISLISPSSLLTDPYAVFWLRTKGVSLHKASAISLNNDFLATAASMFLCWPSIIYMLVNGRLTDLLNDNATKVVFIFIFVGMGLDVIAMGFLFIFGFSKRIHIFASLVFNKIRKTFKISHLTKAQIVEKYMKEAVMRQEFVGMLKNFKGSLFIFLVLLGSNFYMYLCVYMSMVMINSNGLCSISFMHVFSAVNVANSANKFIPAPGGEGTIEWYLTSILTVNNGGDAFHNAADSGPFVPPGNIPDDPNNLDWQNLNYLNKVRGNTTNNSDYRPIMHMLSIQNYKHLPFSNNRYLFWNLWN